MGSLSAPRPFGALALGGCDRVGLFLACSRLQAAATEMRDRPHGALALGGCDRVGRILVQWLLGATASMHNTAKIWNFTTWECTLALAGHG